ncbi:alginate O-acetyltransferase AlgF [Halopseudomonas phragmitis]|uniref:Alginate biosynthesis protein AlgF n=2 Tax=Pseudomonadaceae TaxID=135621 RepID=A0A1V0B2S0_9GAMM|nr:MULTISPECIES: alginate O-acetyltransferase AlgF [Pseudomonadaceae]AQZ94195.1 alginate O-acetyltransferase [Halopseudomonas phragmitis]RHW20693.1 alginate O-acetyltransferase [Pseudomonas jilinensis]
MNVRIYRWLCLPCLLLLATLAQAQDGNADLYDGVAPADSAFVRVFNLGSTSIGFGLSGKQREQRIAAGQLGSYRFTSPGPGRLTIEGNSLEAQFEASSATTVLYKDGQFVLIADKFVDDPRKAQVGFYNLTSQPVALKTRDGKHTVVEAIGTNETGLRAVNEIKIGFSAYAGEQELAQFDEVFLKLGNTYSFMVVEEAGGLRTLSMSSTIDPTE